jgi:hypothetical protein
MPAWSLQSRAICTPRHESIKRSSFHRHPEREKTSPSSWATTPYLPPQRAKPARRRRKCFRPALAGSDAGTPSRKWHMRLPGHRSLVMAAASLPQLCNPNFYATADPR